MKQKLKPETWVGIFLIAGILMIIGVILGFGNIKTSKEQTYPINIIFKDAAGLIKDSQIRLGGVTVGKVTKAPELLPSGNEVMLEASHPERRENPARVRLPGGHAEHPGRQIHRYRPSGPAHA